MTDPSPRPTRAIVIVLDSVGIGELPDAADYGDEGSNTLGNIARQLPLALPNLRRLGLDHLVEMGTRASATPTAARARMAERSPGKDSVTGHWELMGIVLDNPFPVFPNGFPRDLVAEFERRIGRTVIGNRVASGTEIIDTLGEEHLRTGSPILYTSADSVFQIAAHEECIPIAEQYRICEIAYDLVVEGMGVGRVIARPFVGRPGSFSRTSNRHDYARPPAGETLLDRLTSRGVEVSAIGKIYDLFAGRGIGTHIKTGSDDEGVTGVLTQMARQRSGFIFANLVDFDTVYGHRNDVPGYARNLEAFDRRLPEVIAALTPHDLLIVTADHGNDPTTPSTDHSREYVPLLMTGQAVRGGIDLGTRSTFADLGQSLADLFGAGTLCHGASFLSDILQ